MSAQQTVALVLAQAPPSPNDPGGQGEDFGKSSPVGLLLLVVFAIAVVFLVRSMTKHLKRVPVTFDEKRAEAAAPARAVREETGEPGERTGESEKDDSTGS
ncbi:hypothetical protein GCM10025787_36920 [Saccharopolyspora rosea]|uniref:Secreted protein n=1 Tax=Saccharopolyspora rosea TaxID=524884 RepID=A0ABW3FNU3_9PSEU